MFNIKLDSFRVKIIGTLSVIILVIIATLVTISFYSFEEESTHQYKEILRSKNHAIEISVLEKMNSYLNVLSAFDISDEDIGTTLSPQALTQTKALSNALSKVSEGVYLFRRDGGIYDPSGKLFDFNVKDLNREYWKAIFQQGEKTYISAAFDSARTGDKVIAVAYKTGSDVAALATIKLSAVLASLSQYKDLVLYDNEGTVLVTQYKDWLGKNIFERRPMYKQLSVSTPEITYSAQVDGETKTFTAFWGELGLTGWQYITYVNNKEIEASAHHQLAVSSVTGLGFLIFAIAIVLYTLQKLVLIPVGGTPDTIAKYMSDMADGNLTQEYKNTGKGKETGIYKALLHLSSQLSSLIKNSHAISQNVSAASTQLTAIMENTKSNSQTELLQVEQISNAVKELSSTSNEVSSKAVMAEDAARKALDSVNSGKSSLEKTIALTSDINNSIMESSGIIEELHQFSIEIGSVIDVINGISEQTNLLALNAAIEAARAGEAGRGFAVVADEVRNLASKTQQSTVNIQDIIEKLQAQAERATRNMTQNVELIDTSVVLADSVKSSFEEILSAVDSISEINALVATASQEQYAVTEEVATNTTLTLELVSKNVESIDETLQAANELAQMAHTQKAELDYFKV